MTVEYNLKSVKIPRLAGAALKVFVQLLENPLGRGLLLGNLMRSAGVEAFRRREFSETPTFMPFWPDEHRPNATQTAGPDLDAVSHPETAAAGFAYAGVADYRRAYENGQTHPEEIAEWVIGSMAASNTHTPALRAIIDSSAEDVRAQARASAARWKNGRPLSVFAGYRWRSKMSSTRLATAPVPALHLSELPPLPATPQR